MGKRCRFGRKGSARARVTSGASCGWSSIDCHHGNLPFKWHRGDVARVPAGPQRLPNKCNSLSRSAGGPLALDSNLLHSHPHTLLMPKGCSEKNRLLISQLLCFWCKAFWNPRSPALAINIALSSLTSKAEFPLCSVKRATAARASTC
jgi:hypothetical protein